MGTKEGHALGHHAKSKNKAADDGGWCTEDLFFDSDGCLFIANSALALAIQASLNAWGGHFCMTRQAFPGEKNAEGGPIEGNKANMMCPC